MNTQRIAEIFHTVGKLLFVADLGASSASGIKSAINAVQVQNASASGSANPYNELQAFTAPLLNQCNSITQALDRIENVTDSAIVNYLRAIAVEFGLAASASANTVAAAIASAMTGTGDTVAPSGQLWTYFDDTFSALLPMNAEPSIADSIITVTII